MAIPSDDAAKSGEKLDVPPKAKNLVDAIITKPAPYLLLAIGMILGFAGTWAAAWGRFGEKVQSEVLDFLDPSGRGELHRAVDTANHDLAVEKAHSADLDKQLTLASDKAQNAEEKLNRIAPLPLDMTARAFTADRYSIRVRLSIRNTSPDQVEFSFSPKKPQLVVWNKGKTEADSISDSQGLCEDEDNCFSNTSLGKLLHRSLTLQPGSSLATDIIFSNVSSDFDSSDLKNAVLNLPIRTIDGKRTERELRLSSD